MSTWLDDLPPDLQAAYRIVGNQDRHFLRNMVKALQLCPWLNTPDDEKRLAAAKLILLRRHSNHTDYLYRELTGREP